jgi:hypothetical protein
MPRADSAGGATCVIFADRPPTARLADFAVGGTQGWARFANQVRDDPPLRLRGSRLLNLRLCLRLLKPCKVQTVYQFDGCRWRERQAMGDLDNGLLALCWRLIRFFKMEPERAKRQIHGATIEYRAEKLVCINLDNRRVVLNAKFRLLLFGHG